MATMGQPPAQVVQPGVPIRFAVGTPEGPRSRTWTVLGGTREPDVLLGPGAHDPFLRLSRRRDTLRLEYRPDSVRRSLSSSRGRRISDWALPAHADGCWRRALSIVVPSTSLVPTGWHDPAGSGTAFWPPAPAGSIAQFDILLGTPGHWGLTSEIAGEVGRTALAGAGALWVAVHYPSLSPDGQADLARRHAAQLDGADGSGPGWAAAVAGANGQVVLFDFSHDERWWQEPVPVG
jgi:hypothetical protein